MDEDIIQNFEDLTIGHGIKPPLLLPCKSFFASQTSAPLTPFFAYPASLFPLFVRQSVRREEGSLRFFFIILFYLGGIVRLVAARLAPPPGQRFDSGRRTEPESSSGYFMGWKGPCDQPSTPHIHSNSSTLLLPPAPWTALRIATALFA